MKKHHRLKKTISIKQFIAEFGEGFSKHMKLRLLELGSRCILTRKDNTYTLDLKHIEHTKYDCASECGENLEVCQKEYAYGQLIVNEGILYFSQDCLENDEVMIVPAVSEIYKSLSSEDMYLEEGVEAKKVDDTNIDYVVDGLLKVCPEVSAEHLAIISKYCN